MLRSHIPCLAALETPGLGLCAVVAHVQQSTTESVQLATVVGEVFVLVVVAEVTRRLVDAVIRHLPGNGEPKRPSTRMSAAKPDDSSRE